MPWPYTSPTGSPLPNMDANNLSRIPSYTDNLTGSSIKDTGRVWL